MEIQGNVVQFDNILTKNVVCDKVITNSIVKHTNYGECLISPTKCPSVFTIDVPFYKDTNAMSQPPTFNLIAPYQITARTLPYQTIYHHTYDVKNTNAVTFFIHVHSCETMSAPIKCVYRTDSLSIQDVDKWDYDEIMRHIAYSTDVLSSNGVHISVHSDYSVEVPESKTNDYSFAHPFAFAWMFLAQYQPVKDVRNSDLRLFPEQGYLESIVSQITDVIDVTLADRMFMYSINTILESHLYTSDESGNYSLNNEFSRSLFTTYYYQLFLRPVSSCFANFSVNHSADIDDYPSEDKGLEVSRAISGYQHPSILEQKRDPLALNTSLFKEFHIGRMYGKSKSNSLNFTSALGISNTVVANSYWPYKGKGFEDSALSFSPYWYINKELSDSPELITVYTYQVGLESFKFELWPMESCESPILLKEDEQFEAEVGDVVIAKSLSEYTAVPLTRLISFPMFFAFTHDGVVLESSSKKFLFFDTLQINVSEFSGINSLKICKGLYLSLKSVYNTDKEVNNIRIIRDFELPLIKDSRLFDLSYVGISSIFGMTFMSSYFIVSSLPRYLMYKIVSSKYSEIYSYPSESVSLQSNQYGYNGYIRLGNVPSPSVHSNLNQYGCLPLVEILKSEEEVNGCKYVTLQGESSFTKYTQYSNPVDSLKFFCVSNYNKS